VKSQAKDEKMPEFKNMNAFEDKMKGIVDTNSKVKSDQYNKEVVQQTPSKGADTKENDNLIKPNFIATKEISALKNIDTTQDLFLKNLQAKNMVNEESARPEGGDKGDRKPRPQKPYNPNYKPNPNYKGKNPNKNKYQNQKKTDNEVDEDGFEIVGAKKEIKQKAIYNANRPQMTEDEKIWSASLGENQDRDNREEKKEWDGEKRERKEWDGEKREKREYKPRKDKNQVKKGGAGGGVWETKPNKEETEDNATTEKAPEKPVIKIVEKVEVTIQAKSLNDIFSSKKK